MRGTSIRGSLKQPQALLPLFPYSKISCRRQWDIGVDALQAIALLMGKASRIFTFHWGPRGFSDLCQVKSWHSSKQPRWGLGGEGSDKWSLLTFPRLPGLHWSIACNAHSTSTSAFSSRLAWIWLGHYNNFKVSAKAFYKTLLGKINICILY